MPLWASLAAKEPTSKVAKSKFEVWATTQAKDSNVVDDGMSERGKNRQLEGSGTVASSLGGECDDTALPASCCTAPDLASEDCTTHEQAWARSLLAATQVYVLCIPKRRAHAEQLMQRWGFHEAEFVEGPDKTTMDLEACLRDGLITTEYEDVIYEDAEYSPQGKVACHFGHLRILQRLLDLQDKSYAIIFEDDLEDKPHCDDDGRTVMGELLQFLGRVPPDFDLIHLGFVRESRRARQLVDEDATVFRSAEALGRHAYMVTRSTARLLLEHTLPMYNHGDKMFQQTYRQHGLKAYQPREPLFYQDRVHFDSELTSRWKPQRPFQPTEDDDGIRDIDREEMHRRQQRPRAEEPILDLQPTAALFLDVDGVLNTASSHDIQDGRPQRPQMRHLHALLGAASDAGHTCVIVLTSRWRTEVQWQRRFPAALERNGVPRSLLTVTPLSTSSDGSMAEERGREIMHWLAENCWVKTWAVVDTTDFSKSGNGELVERWVRTDPEHGLRAADVDAVLAILRRLRGPPKRSAASGRARPRQGCR